MAPYRAGLIEGGHGEGTARLGGVMEIIVADDPDQVTRELIPHLAHQVSTYQQGRGGTAELDELAGEFSATFDRTRSVPGLKVLTPDDTAAEIRTRTDGLPVEHVYLWSSLAGMPDHIVERHLELLFTSVKQLLAGTSGC